MNRVRNNFSIETAVSSIVKETEHIAYYQSAVHPQDVVVRLSNANGNTIGDVTKGLI